MQSAALKTTSPDSGASLQPELQPVSGWSSTTTEVIVDSQDKGSWPSVGDKSETVSSDGDTDNASVKSVISSSSVPSQGHGDISGHEQGSTAMQSQSQSASSMWGATMSTGTSESKMEPNSTWGITTPSSINSMWDSASDNKAAGTNPRTGIQTLPNGILTSVSLSNMSGSNPSTTAGGWGDSLPGDGQFTGNSSGAQNDQGSLPGSGQSNSFGSAMWQGIRSMSDALSEMDNKDAASQGSGWGSQSSSSSVIGSGLSISANSGNSFNTKGVSAMKQENVMSQWGQNTTSASSTPTDVWGTTSSDPAGGAGSGGSGFDTKSEHSGWGSPCPSPITNAGTEGWGMQEPRKPPNQTWGQSPTATTWDQPERRSSTSSWDQQSSSDRNTSSAWADPPKPDNNSGWTGPEANRPAPSAWGPPNDVKPNTNQSQAQWGSSGASGPQSQWPGGSASQPPSSNSSNQMGAWGSGNPITSRPPQAPRPIGPQVPPSQQPTPPPQQPQPPQQPGSWAEAAGRGLNAKPNPVGTTNRKITKEEIINEAINTLESWGKIPVRQDTSWDNIEDSPKLPPKPLGSTSSAGSQEDLHWNQPNNGTAIWESAKESAPSAAPPPSTGNTWDRSGASGNNEWGASNDNDGGTWNGGGPPQQPQQSQLQPQQHQLQHHQLQQQHHQQQQQHHHQHHHQQHQQQDSNVWQGPPNNASSNNSGNATNWNHPPKQGDMWMGNEDRQGSGSYSSGSSGSNDSKKNWQGNQNSGHGNQNSGPKGDNVWDVNGTSVWGDPEKTETGIWKGGTEGMRRNSSTGNWERENENSGNWNNRRDDRGQNFEHGGGTAYWGNPEKPPHWNNSSNPSTPMTPHGPMPPQPIPGRPPSMSNDKGPMWGQTPPQPPKPSWDANPSGGRDDVMWNQQTKPNSNWNEPQWQRQKSQSGSNWGEGEWNGMPNSRKPPQRSRMLQQLMDMGFKKEDAQNALIRSDMDLDRAINDLVASAKRPEYDPELHRGRQLKGMGSAEDLADAPGDPSPFMPPQNPLNNAQGLLNTQVIASPYVKSGPSLQHNVMSSHSTSINQLPHKLPPPLNKPPVSGPPGQNIRGQLPNQTQQMIQAQIVQQLQMAVQAGLISPQLLNQHLTPAMLVMLQQLLQLQQVYQQLVAQQQVLQQNKTLPPLHQRTQLEQISLTIAKIKQKIAQAQQALAKQATSQQPPNAGMDPNKELLKDLQDLQLKDQAAAQQAQQQQNQQAQSRLQQWKLPSPDKLETLDLNRAPGSRPMGPHSTPNLQIKQEPGTQFSDPWSSLPSANTLWPSTSTTVTTTASAPQIGTKTSMSNTGKESPNEEANSSSSSTNASPNTTATSTSAALDIEEFVPGKPWQGIITKSVEDDPHLTPGHAAMRRPISISTINDEYVMSTLGKSSSSSSLNKSPTVSDVTNTPASWSSGVPSSNIANSSSSPNLLGRSSWSGTVPSDTAPSMFLAGDIWSGGPPKSRRPPPGLMNRSVSCPGGPGSWGSNWLILKNLPGQVDGSTVKNLCNQHGPLQTFLHSAQYGQAYVCYKAREDAIKAQKSLNGYPFGNSTIMADFVSDTEANRLQEMSAQSAMSSNTGAGHFPQPPMHSGLRPAFAAPKYEQAAQLNGAANFSVGGGNMWGSGGAGGGLWGPIEEQHPDHMLPGGLLGGH